LFSHCILSFVWTYFQVEETEKTGASPLRKPPLEADTFVRPWPPPYFSAVAVYRQRWRLTRKKQVCMETHKKNYHATVANKIRKFI
jgi:hypothetical protein